VLLQSEQSFYLREEGRARSAACKVALYEVILHVESHSDEPLHKARLASGACRYEVLRCRVAAYATDSVCSGAPSGSQPCLVGMGNVQPYLGDWAPFVDAKWPPASGASGSLRPPCRPSFVTL
jgi:hypothetical protein